MNPVEDGIAEVQSLRTLWALGNSVLELPDGDILVSYRPTSTVIRIDRRTGELSGSSALRRWPASTLRIPCRTATS